MIKLFAVLMITIAGLTLVAPTFISDVWAQDHASAADILVEVTEVQSQDGTILRIKGGDVFVVDDRGAENVAPDAVHILKSGVTLETKDGKIIEPRQP